MNKIAKHTQFINKKFEFFDVTADIGYWAYGKTLEEAYENAALAMFNVITNTDKVSQKVSKEIAIESEDLVSLLYDFLEELLILHELNLMFFSKFEIAIKKEEINNESKYTLKGIAIGEEINWKVHEKGSEVKAITFHQMEVITNSISKVRVILDL
ncbi:MAG: archease [Methanobrevibacter sp.]|jgi:SHS2 domain-containing protein|nr:archease [Methanobrevibacter sp.]